MIRTGGTSCVRRDGCFEPTVQNLGRRRAAHPGKSLRKRPATWKEDSEDACRNAGKKSKPEAKLAYALGPLGNLFLLATLSELRRHRLTYLAFYALQRSIDEADQESDRPYSERRLRTESQ